MIDPDEKDPFRLDPSKFPKQLDIDLTPETLERLQKVAAESGRSVDELILEILDQGLQDRLS